MLEDQLNEIEAEEERIDELNARLDDIYGVLAPDEVELLMADCEQSWTEMIEVIETYDRYVAFSDFKNEIVYPRVSIAREILPLLRPRDNFLATVGYRSGQWHVLMMSRRFLNDGFNARCGDKNCELCAAEAEQVH